MTLFQAYLFDLETESMDPIGQPFRADTALHALRIAQAYWPRAVIVGEVS